MSRLLDVWQATRAASSFIRVGWASPHFFYDICIAIISESILGSYSTGMEWNWPPKVWMALRPTYYGPLTWDSGWTSITCSSESSQMQHFDSWVVQIGKRVLAQSTMLFFLHMEDLCGEFFYIDAHFHMLTNYQPRACPCAKQLSISSGRHLSRRIG